ncbi:25725_t:CDS:1, partial [Dentiscutata erythropus]
PQVESGNNINEINKEDEASDPRSGDNLVEIGETKKYLIQKFASLVNKKLKP